MKKAAIVINETLKAGLLANAIACITTGLFSNEDDVLGPDIQGQEITLSL